MAKLAEQNFSIVAYTLGQLAIALAGSTGFASKSLNCCQRIWGSTCERAQKSRCTVLATFVVVVVCIISANLMEVYGNSLGSWWLIDALCQVPQEREGNQ